MKLTHPALIFSLALLTHLVVPPNSLFAQTDFYQGKTIRIIHGRDPGGSGDLRVKAMVQFLQKYVPGNPIFVNEYMPGGGGRKTANYIFGAARPDGLTIGNVGGGVVANAVLGEKGVEYDLDRLHFIGSPYSATHYLFLTRREAGLNTMEKLRAAAGVRVGAQSVGHTIYNTGRIMAWFLDLKEPKFVTGYSTPERDVALLRGEIDGMATTDDHLVRNPDWVSKGLMHFHTIIEIPKGLKYPGFSDLPELESFARSERERKLLALVRNLRLTGSPFILPPNTPKDRLDIIKEAMRKTLSDRAFYKEYQKLVGEEPTPLLPDANEKAIRDIPRDAETIGLFKKFVGPGPLPPR
jgi:tripartite-type tricarboxylate transporter receptor subunit TctC